MSDTLRINPPPPRKKGEYRPPLVVPPPDNLDELRERLADAEARIEALETALAAVTRAIVYGKTTPPYPGPRSDTPHHQHALYGIQTIRHHLAHAVEVLGRDIALLDEEG